MDFTSQTTQLGRGALNWDTQVKNDFSSLQGYFQQGAWTPLLGGPNVNIGSGPGALTGGTFSRFGDEVTMHGFLRFGTGGTFGANRATVYNMPFNSTPYMGTGYGDYYRDSSNGAGVALTFVEVNTNTFEIRPVQNLGLGLGYDLGTPNPYDFVRFTLNLWRL